MSTRSTRRYTTHRTRREPYVSAETACVFSALGDQTRLAIVERLSHGPPRSIAELTAGSALTRQAITKHLHVLEHAGVVRGVRAGRENLYELRPQHLEALQSYMEHVSAQWEQALARLKAFVEE